MRLVLLGPPGAGKGSLAKLLQESLKVKHISTGDILRAQMKEGTGLGLEAKGYVDRGELVPDELVTRLMDHTLSNAKDIERGYMLDGYPRTSQQAQDLDKILERLSIPLDCALYMEAGLDMVVRRLTGRRVCKKCGALFHIHNKPPKKEGVCDECGDELFIRADDNEETIRKRMDIYLSSTKPIVEFYQAQGKLKKINGDEETEDLHKALLAAWNE